MIVPDYLEEGFDPATKRVAELRAILNTHDVDFPPNAKKAKMIQLFNHHIENNKDELKKNWKPAAPKKRKRKEKDEDLPRKTSKMDLEEDDDTRDLNISISVSRFVPDLSDEELMEQVLEVTKPKKKTTKVEKPKKKKKVKQVEKEEQQEEDTKEDIKDKLAEQELFEFDEKRNEILETVNGELPVEQPLVPEVINLLPKARGPQFGSSSSNLPLSPNASATPTKSARSPRIKLTPKPRLLLVNATDFSDDDSEVDEIDVSRVSTGSDSFKKVKTPISKKVRKKENKQFKDKNPTKIVSNASKERGTPRRLGTPKSKTTPKSTKGTPKPKRSPASDDSDEDYSDSDSDSEPSESPFRNAVPTLFSFLVWGIFILLTWFGWWYHQQLYIVGYCGSEQNIPTFAHTKVAAVSELGHWLDTHFRPQCTPCPQHARCFPNLQLGCFEDFVDYTPWNNWLVPTNKRCIPDSKKALKLELMIENAKDLLREKNARRQCGKSRDNVEAGIAVADLHDFLLEMKAPYISREEFEELWLRSLVELEKEPEIIVRQVHDETRGSAPGSVPRTNSITNNQKGYPACDAVGSVDVADQGADCDSSHTFLRSTSLSNLSLGCQFRNSILGLMARYQRPLAAVVAVVVVIQVIKYRLRKYQEQKLKVEIIYKDVLKRLHRQAREAKLDPEKAPFIGLVQLRDIILSDDHDLNHRVKLWNKTVPKVERNTNIASKVIEDHGEIFKVWQWVSDVDHIDHQWVSPKGKQHES